MSYINYFIYYQAAGYEDNAPNSYLWPYFFYSPLLYMALLFFSSTAHPNQISRRNCDFLTFLPPVPVFHLGFFVATSLSIIW